MPRKITRFTYLAEANQGERSAYRATIMAALRWARNDWADHQQAVVIRGPRDGDDKSLSVEWATLTSGGFWVRVVPGAQPFVDALENER